MYFHRNYRSGTVCHLKDRSVTSFGVLTKYSSDVGRTREMCERDKRKRDEGAGDECKK